MIMFVPSIQRNLMYEYTHIKRIKSKYRTPTRGTYKP